jgi:hypothetical protein
MGLRQWALAFGGSLLTLPGILAFLRDRAERKKKEAALRKGERPRIIKPGDPEFSMRT